MTTYEKAQAIMQSEVAKAQAEGLQVLAADCGVAGNDSEYVAKFFMVEGVEFRRPKGHFPVNAMGIEPAWILVVVASAEAARDFEQQRVESEQRAAERLQQEAEYIERRNKSALFIQNEYGETELAHHA